MFYNQPISFNYVYFRYKVRYTYNTLICNSKILCHNKADFLLGHKITTIFH